MSGRRPKLGKPDVGFPKKKKQFHRLRWSAGYGLWSLVTWFIIEESRNDLQTSKI